MDDEVPAAIAGIQEGLEQALAAVKVLEPWVEHVQTLAGIMQQMDSSLAKARPVLGESRPTSEPIPISERLPDHDEGDEEQAPEDVPAAGLQAEGAPPSTTATAPGLSEEVASAEPVPSQEPDGGEAVYAKPGLEAGATASPEATLGTGSTTPPDTAPRNEVAAAIEAALLQGEEADKPTTTEQAEGASEDTEGGPTVRLVIESAEANIDLTGLAHAAWESCRASDLDLLDYSGKKALVQLDLSGDDDIGDAESKNRVAAKVQEHLVELPWGNGVTVRVVE